MIRFSQLLDNVPRAMRGSAREIGLLLVASVILLGLTGFSFYLAQRSIRDGEIADRLNRFNAELTKFVQMLRTAESSQRGYLLTSDAVFLEPYAGLVRELPMQAKNLMDTLPGNLSEGARLAAVQPALKGKLVEMQETLDLAQMGQTTKAFIRVANRQGFELTKNIETNINALEGETSRIVGENMASSAWLQRVKFYVDALGAMLILTFAFLSLRLLMQSNNSLREAQEELASSNVQLESIVSQRTAALTRANEEIQRFAYIVSHDLRSPLVNIMGFTTELENLRKDLFGKLAEANALSETDALGKDFDEALGFIKNSIARMDRLINAILRISREGNRPLNSEIVDMTAMLDGILGAMAHQTKEKGVTIEVGNIPNVIADRLALEQIFSNLIENATKFLRPGVDGLIRVEGAGRGHEVVYSITDNGRGIDKRDHQRIFELFRRSGPQNVPGEGMGLAYVTALMRRLGGSVEVQSELGKGSTFKLTLPNTAAAQRRIAA